MKKLLLFIFAHGFIMHGALAQVGETPFEIGDIITFNTDTKHVKTNAFWDKNTELKEKQFTRDTVNFNQIILEPNIKFRIIEKTETGIFKIVAIPFKPLKENKETITNKNDKSFYYNYRVFEVDKDEFLAKAGIVEDIERFSVGILTLPFKFRPQGKKSFEAQFNLNSTLNWMFWNNAFGTQTKMSLQLGAGLGSVSLNESNASGISANEEIDASTLSMFGGVMLQYNKVQTGIYLGVDHINNQNHYQWKNNGNIWFSLGIGYQLFNVDLGSAKNKKQTKQ